MLFAIQNEREWLNFCAGVLGNPALATDRRFSSTSARTANRVELDAIILKAFSHSTSSAILERLDAARIANGRANSVKDVLAHPHLREIAVQAGDDVVTMPAAPAIRRDETRSYGAVPALDGDGETIRAEFADQTGARNQDKAD